MDFEDSKTYEKIREHRTNCPKWGNGFCLDCFGGGLNRTISNWKNDERIREMLGRKTSNKD